MTAIYCVRRYVDSPIPMKAKTYLTTSGEWVYSYSDAAKFSDIECAVRAAHRHWNAYVSDDAPNG